MNNNPMASSKSLLLTGFQSFAANGLPRVLASQGWIVDGIARRSSSPVEGIRNQAVGNLLDLQSASTLDASYDTVVNYLMLKNDSIEQNERYLTGLLKFCLDRNVKHLVHISSISVYPGTKGLVIESTPIETEPSRKGAYGAVKVASDIFLNKNAPDSLRITFIRPGFILGEGLVDPIVGMGLRSPFNRPFLIGNSRNTVPITTREIVNEAIVRAVAKSNNSEPARNCFMLVSPNSPSRKEYLDFLGKAAGYGKGTLWAPNFLWKSAAICGRIMESVIGNKISISKPLWNATRAQTFDSTKTSESLGMNLSVDWKEEVVKSLEGQEANFLYPSEQKSDWIQAKGIKTIGFIGWGRIVKQRHLPALIKLGIDAEIVAYDVFERTEQSGQVVQQIPKDRLEVADLYVVASPGPQHYKSIPLLETIDCPILVEKPVAYDATQLDAWKSFSERRKQKVFVCHNYRFKANVAKMWKTLSDLNPGRLLHADLWFQSPPVANESAAWLRDERKSRTLLYDYAIHFLDLACMFDTNAWKLNSIRSCQNARGETSLIQGVAEGAEYSVSFLIRQGAVPRRASIRFVFQNYDVNLDFFPDTMSYSCSGASSYLLRSKASSLSKSIRLKILEKISGRDYDDSHSIAIHSALNGQESLIELDKLDSFYRLLFEIGDRVYE